MRLIDADAVLAALSIFDDTDGAHSHFMNGIKTAIEIIEDAPTEDAVPVKPLAKWLAERYIAHGYRLPLKFYPEWGSRGYDTNVEDWEQILREKDWEADE